MNGRALRASNRRRRIQACPDAVAGGGWPHVSGGNHPSRTGNGKVSIRACGPYACHRFVGHSLFRLARRGVLDCGGSRRPWRNGGSMKKVYVVLLGAVVVAAVAAPFVKNRLDDVRVVLPTFERPANVVMLDQNWTNEQRDQFHHITLSTRLLLAGCFMVVVQPFLSPLGCGRFSDPEYPSRLWSNPSATSELDLHGLPVGFAIDKDTVDPIA